MDTALVVGGTRFIGRHLVEELLDCGYEVTLFNRGVHDDPFADREGVDHVEGDRTVETDLRAAALSVDPDAVFDVVAYRPGEVETAVDVFADVDAYVYVSSGAAYREAIPKREGETPLRPCDADQATDDSMATYGPRKAEGDRVVARAAQDGVNATSVRPCLVYGPHDYNGLLDYWIGRVETRDRVVVPGDGTNLRHRVYVEDVASALRIAAEAGTPGRAYNVGDRRLLTLGDLVELLAVELETEVEVVHAGERELAAVDLVYDDFPLYRSSPHVLDTNRLADLEWASTPVEEATARTVADYRERDPDRATDRDGDPVGPDRATEERLLGLLDTL